MQWAPRGRPVPPVSVWDEFAAGVRARSDVRVCLSTEDFGRIRSAERSRKVVADLGAPSSTSFAVTRAYHRLMPSHWQERVKSHERRSYDEWLRELLEGDDSHEVHRRLWTSHDVEFMASRWLDVLPPDRFTLVVTDDSDRELLPRTFEQLLGLHPSGLLAPAESTNASLSMNAAEVLRRVDRRVRGARVARPRLRAAHPGGDGQGAAGRRPERRRRGGSGAARVGPAAGGRAERAPRQTIARLGINVVGDPSCLLLPDEPAADTAGLGPERISVEAAALAVSGVVSGALQRQRALAAQLRNAQQQGRSGSPALADVGRRALLGEALGSPDRTLAPRSPYLTESLTSHLTPGVGPSLRGVRFMVFPTVRYPHRPSSEGGRRDLNVKEVHDPTTGGRDRGRSCRRRPRLSAALARPRDRVRGR